MDAPKHPRASRAYWNLRLFGLPEPARDVWMLVLTVVLVVIAVHASDDASQTTRSLCALRHDLEERVAGSDNFLRDHPRGFAGIPAATIRASADGQRRTIRALSNLKCPPPPSR